MQDGNFVLPADLLATYPSLLQSVFLLCLFRSLVISPQMVHFSLIPMCTLITCLASWHRVRKNFSHCLHLNCILTLPLCFLLTCIPRRARWTVTSQSGHLTFSFRCTLLMCFLRSVLGTNLLSHCSHWKLATLLWTKLKWLLRFLTIFPHSRHCSCNPMWTLEMWF